jgi:hypothetical protein
MKRTQHLWLIALGVVACLACMIGGLSKTPVQAQTPTDDGYFTVYVYLDYDGSNVYGSTYYVVDPFEDIGGSSPTGPPLWTLSGGSYSAGGAGYSFSSGPVPVGNTYNVAVSYNIEYAPVGDACTNNYEYDGYECYDNATGYASVYVPYPPPQISSISPNFDVQGASGTIHVQGQNLLDGSGTLNAYFRDSDISVSVNSGADASHADLSYSISPTASIGVHQLVLQNSGGESEPASFTVNSASPKQTQPPSRLLIHSVDWDDRWHRNHGRLVQRHSFRRGQPDRHLRPLLHPQFHRSQHRRAHHQELFPVRPQRQSLRPQYCLQRNYCTWGSEQRSHRLVLYDR